MIYVLIGCLAGIIYPMLIVAAMKGKAFVFRAILSYVILIAFAVSSGIVMINLVSSTR